MLLFTPTGSPGAMAAQSHAPLPQEFRCTSREIRGCCCCGPPRTAKVKVVEQAHHASLNQLKELGKAHARHLVAALVHFLRRVDHIRHSDDPAKGARLVVSAAHEIVDSVEREGKRRAIVKEH